MQGQEENGTIKVMPLITTFRFTDLVSHVRYSLMALLLGIILLSAGLLIMAKYPFKTVEFLGKPPIKITNPGKVVMNGTVVKMQINYVKYTNAPALIVRTLVRRKRAGDNMGQDILPLGSSTVISTRKSGEGVTESIFPLNTNDENVGPNTTIIFTIYYNLYGFIPRMVQYESEPFTIVPCIGTPCPEPRQNGLKKNDELVVQKALISFGVIPQIGGAYATRPGNRD